MFDEIRQALHDLLHGDVPPEGRREVLQQMRETLVRARMGLDDVRDGIAATERRLAAEQSELETVRRRRALAEGVQDAETAEIAARFEAHHAERVALLERRLAAERDELAMVEREVAEMTVQFKAASAGVGAGLRATSVGEDVGSDDALAAELRGLDREQRRAATDAEAEARLAELKRRMGR